MKSIVDTVDNTQHLCSTVVNVLFKKGKICYSCFTAGKRNNVQTNVGLHFQNLMLIVGSSSVRTPTPLAQLILPLPLRLLTGGWQSPHCSRNFSYPFIFGLIAERWSNFFHRPQQRRAWFQIPLISCFRIPPKTFKRK